MPQITPYMPQVQPQGPVAVQRATGEDFGSQVGAAVQQAASSAEDLGSAALRWQTQKETSDADAKLSKVQADMTNELEQKKRDGTLDSQAFGDELQSRLDEISDGLSTPRARQMYKVASAQMQMHFNVQATQGQAEIAGKQTIAAHDTSMESRSSSLEQNPDLFQLSVQQNTATNQSLVDQGLLRADQVDELNKKDNTELAKSAIYGLAKRDPDEATHQLDSGKWDAYMNGDVKRRMYNEVRQVQEQKMRDTALAQKVVDQRNAQIQEQTAVGFLQKMHDPNGNGLMAMDVMNALKDGKIDSTTAEHFWKAIDAENADKKLKSDPIIFNDLAHRLTLPDGSEGKITSDEEINKYIGTKISVPDAQLLYGLLAEKHTPQGDADSALQKSYFDLQRGRTVKKDPLGMEDPQGLQIYQNVQAQSYQYALQARQNGKSSMQIWSPTMGGKDNPDYVGNHVNAPIRTMQDKIKSQMDLLKKKTGPPDSTLMQDEHGVKMWIPNQNVGEALKRNATRVTN